MNNTQIQKLQNIVNDLEQRTTALETEVERLVNVYEELTSKFMTSNRTSPSKRAMTDEDARKVFSTENANKKHKDLADELGLEYGQVYSARRGYTFKHIARQMKDEGECNQWTA